MVADEQMIGRINFIGASLGGEQLLDVSIYGDVLDFQVGSISTHSGADINLNGNELSTSRLMGLGTISPAGGVGGDINIFVDDVGIRSTIRTTAMGGEGGDINFNADNLRLTSYQIADSEYYLPGLTGYPTGDININVRNELKTALPIITTRSYSGGGTGDLNINAGTFKAEGLDFLTSTSMQVKAVRGKTGQVNINADIIDFESIKSSDTKFFQSYFTALLDEGVYIAPSQFEAGFMSAVHTDEEIEQTIEANYTALKKACG